MQVFLVPIEELFSLEKRKHNKIDRAQVWGLLLVAIGCISKSSRVLNTHDGFEQPSVQLDQQAWVDLMCGNGGFQGLVKGLSFGLGPPSPGPRNRPKGTRPTR